MTRFTTVASVVAALLGAFACSGGGNDATYACVTCVCPTNCPTAKTLDTTYYQVLPADSLDAEPNGLYVQEHAVVSGRDSVVKVFVTAWAAKFAVVFPVVGSVDLIMTGDARYEKITKTLSKSDYLGHTVGAVLKPACWNLRGLTGAGKTQCVSSTALKTALGTSDTLAFYPRWTNATVIVPWTWSLGTATIFLNDASAGGPFSAPQADSISGMIDKINAEKLGGPTLIYGGRTTDPTPAAGRIVVNQVSTTGGTSTVPVVGAAAGDIVAATINLSPNGVSAFSKEIMNALGFGHTCQWTSRMTSTDCSARSSSWYSLEDLYGFQVAFAMRTQTKSINAALGFWDSSP